MIRNKRKLLMISSLVFALALIVWLHPRIASFFNILQARQLVEDAKREIRLEDRSILCAAPANSSSLSKPNLETAMHKLDEAVELAPKISDSYLLIGQIRCLEGKTAEAVAPLETYTHLKQGDQIAHLELSAAYEAKCREQDPSSSKLNASAGNLWSGLCGEENYQILIRHEWELAGVVVGNFQHYAEQDFQQGRLLEAAHWFQKAAILGENLSEENFFKWSLASLYSGRDLPTLEGRSILVSSLTDETTIEGENLYWTIENPSMNLTFGSQLIDFPSTEPEVGPMWWRGAAVTFVKIETPGIYKITLKVKGQGAGPLQLQIERNLIPIDILNVDSKEDGWQEIASAGFFQEGMYTLGVRLIEDRGNVFIDWIRLELVQE